jgi:hypothetical protein
VLVSMLAGFVASDPVVTSLAGFAGGRRPHAHGGRTPGLNILSVLLSV